MFEDRHVFKPAGIVATAETCRTFVADLIGELKSAKKLRGTVTLLSQLLSTDLLLSTAGRGTVPFGLAVFWQPLKTVALLVEAVDLICYSPKNPGSADSFSRGELMGLLLSQILGQVPHSPFVGSTWLIGTLGGLTSLVYFVLFFYMLYHCDRNEPDRNFWFWIIFIAQPFGLVAYILVRYLPSRDVRIPAKFLRWTRQRELTRLEIAAEQIGNPYQYILWGDALRDVRMFDQAFHAYGQALAKDPRNLQALWGSAQVALIQKRYSDVLSFTAVILEMDPEYKFGDVLLAHGRALSETGKDDEALSSLDKHVKRWRHPESLYLLAEIHDRRGDSKTARECLTMLVKDINASPAPIARRHGRWKNMANRRLKKMAAS